MFGYGGGVMDLVVCCFHAPSLNPKIMHIKPVEGWYSGPGAYEVRKQVIQQMGRKHGWTELEERIPLALLKFSKLVKDGDKSVHAEMNVYMSRITVSTRIGDKVEPYLRNLEPDQLMSLFEDPLKKSAPKKKVKPKK